MKKNKTLIYIILALVITNVISISLLAYSEIFSIGKWIKIIELRDEIDKKFYMDVDEGMLLEGALKGMFESLGDKYSYYLDSDEMNLLVNKSKGIMIGIGIGISIQNDGKILVLDVTKDGSADIAGIKSNDVITSIDRVDLTTENVEELISSIGNVKKKYIVFGEYPELELKINRDGKILDFIVDRKAIYSNEFEYNVIEDIGYIRIGRFINQTPEYLKSALHEINNAGIDSLIIDLKDNPGGLLDSVVESAGYFIGKQEIIMTNDKNNNKKSYVSPNEKLFNGKICILVNKNTASAAEVLTAALKDYGLATIIGEQTYGKGVVQTSYQLLDKSGYKLTTSEYFTPSGKSINNVGIAPDIKMEIEDEQISYAIKILKEGTK